jgi:transcription elongation factor Elf1
MRIIGTLREIINLAFSSDSDEAKFDAVHEENIETILEGLDLLDKIKSGEISCHSCGCHVTVESIGKISGKYEDIALFCDAYTCMYETFHSPQDEIPEEEIEDEIHEIEIDDRWTPEREIDDRWTPERILINIDDEYTIDEQEEGDKITGEQ